MDLYLYFYHWFPSEILAFILPQKMNPARAGINQQSTIPRVSCNKAGYRRNPLHQFQLVSLCNHKTLWKKICDWFKNLANDLKELVEAYKDYKPDSPEGRMVADMQDAIVIFESIYADALVEASENFQRAEKKPPRTVV